MWGAVPVEDLWRRTLLTVAGVVLLSMGSVQGQDDGQWVAPYPQLPEYREVVGRLYGESPPTNRRVPDITSRGVVAAGIFAPKAKAGELTQAFASFTFARDANDVPQFSDLRVIVKDVTQIRRGTASSSPVRQRRTGTPTPGTQACVDRQMIFHMFQLDARWRSVAECQDTLSWSAWAPHGGVAVAASGASTPGYQWVQRSAEAPDYREYGGRLFGEASLANNDSRFGNLTAPAVIAIGVFRPMARPGETFASYGKQFFNLDSENQLDLATLRIVVNSLTEVRFSRADALGVVLETRKGTPAYGYHQCLEVRVPRAMYLVDGRWRAMAQCEDLVLWAPWTGENVRPASGSFAADGMTTLEYAWDESAGHLKVTLR